MNYSDLEKVLQKKIENSTIEIIGKSVLDRSIYAVKFDFGEKETVIIHGAIHAREYITTDLIIKLIQDVSKNYKKYKTIGTPNLIFVPMVNPDGVELVTTGIKSVKSKEKRKFLININGGKNFSLYKANANGVDLNTNFDAKWGSGKENKLVPLSNGYIGKCPMSEPEVQALALLTIKYKPFFTISYHAKGQEIYYQFYNKKENLRRDYFIAKIISKTLCYKIKNLESVSGGGYKDWCVQRFSIPAVTIEVGKDSLVHPISEDCLKTIYKRNKNIIRILSKIKKVYTDDKSRKVYENGNQRGS